MVGTKRKRTSTGRQQRQTFGQLETLPSGRVRARYTGPDGKRYNAPQTFDTDTDARGWLAVQQAAIVRNEWSPGGAAAAATRQASRALTLGDYSNDWLSTRKVKGVPLRDRTRVEYARLLAGPLAPLLGERLGSVTPARVRAWHDEQTRTGKATQTARAYGLLNTIMATALADDIIPTNPCRLRGAQSATTGRVVLPPTADELQAILAAITPRYRAAVVLAAWAALRYGELTELRRKDIQIRRAPSGDAATIRVKITRAVTHTTGVGYVVGKTKSAAGVREVALPPHVNSVVDAHLLEWVAADADALLFPATDGVTHLAESTFVKHWYPARLAANRADMPWHALRHYGASSYARTGATLKEIQARLGHSTVAAAMRYQHEAGRDEELAALMR